MKKNFNFSITDSTTYTGKDAEGFYSAALLASPTAKNVTLVPNVKSSIKLAKFDLGSVLQAEGSSWSNTGEGTLAQKSFTVCPLAVQLEYFTSTFEQNYLNEQMKAGFNPDEVAPKSFTDYVVNAVGQKVSSDLEKMYWGGNVANSGSTYPYSKCDGLEFKMSADSTVIDVTAAAASAITVSTIIAEVGRLYAAIPNEIISRGNVKIFMATNMVKLFKQAIAAANTITYYTTDVDLNYLGIPIVEAPGMGAYRMVAAEPNNLVWLTDLMDDEKQIAVIPQFLKSGIPSVRIASELKFGAGFIYGAEVVFYWA